MKTLLAFTLAVAMTASAQQKPLPEGYWSEAQSKAILDKTETIRLAPDLSKLTGPEQAALKNLLAVGAIMQKLYEVSRHPEAVSAMDRLRVLDVSLGQPKATQNLLQLYRLYQGPIASTLDNKREAFVPVSPQTPGRNVYPIDATREEIEAFLAKYPGERDALLAERTVVRRVISSSLQHDIATLNAFSLLRQLHPGLLERLRSLQTSTDPSTFYAVPYPIAWPDDLVPAYNLLLNTASVLERTDSEFARYLRNRARDLITNDYESGDASWVTGRFERLNAQIGAYETYDDALFGVKAFHEHEHHAGQRARHRGAAQGPRRTAGHRGRAAVRRAQARARRHPRRRLRSHRRLRPGPRHQHRHHPAERRPLLATLRPHHPAAREHHEAPRHLRRRHARLEGGGGRRAVATTSPPRATSSARSGTRSVTTSASIATNRTARSTSPSRTTPTPSKR